MLTVLKQAQNITTAVLGEGHKTVITFDLQLYLKAIKLQLHKAPALNHLVFRLGEMHTLMAALRALGTSIEDSGFDDAWVEAGIYGSTTKHQILEGKYEACLDCTLYDVLHPLRLARGRVFEGRERRKWSGISKSACCCLKNECILSGRQIQRARGKPQRVPKCNDHLGVSGEEATKL